jgi:uncharacterized LabA/DUF88 family protein
VASPTYPRYLLLLVVEFLNRECTEAVLILETKRFHMTIKTPDRAVLFIDGNNWYHSIKDRVSQPFRLSYGKISSKLIGARQWLETRYYIGALKQDWNPTDYANQRAFLSTIQKDDARVTVHLGRLERRTQINPLVSPLLRIIDDSKMAVPRQAQQEIRTLVRGLGSIETLKEKAVDVMLARDLLVGAMKDQYDCAYLLSADGDFTPVVESARSLNKKIYCASMGFSSELQKVANTFIVLQPEWFDDCYR